VVNGIRGGKVHRKLGAPTQATASIGPTSDALTALLRRLLATAKAITALFFLGVAALLVVVS
jgi:hypothetical protein